MHRPPYCCVLPVVTLRVLTAAGLLPEYFERGPASRISRRCGSPAAPSSRTAYCKTVRFGDAAATATAPALDALLRAGVPRLCDSTTSAKCSVIFLRCSFSGCAARSSFLQGATRRVGLAGPPSQSAFTRSRCIGPHATYPASCAVRMRPSYLSWKESSHEQVSAPSQSVSSRTLGQNRPQTQWISRVQRPHFGSL